MGISLKLDGIRTIYLYTYIPFCRCSVEKKHTQNKTPLCGETLVFHDNNQLHSTNEKPQVEASFPQTDKELIWEKERGEKVPLISFFDVGAYWIFSWERWHIPKVCLKIIFPFPRWDILYSFVGGTKWPWRQKKSFDSWQAIGPTEFLPGSQLFTCLFSKARGVKMGLFAVGWPWWDCFYSQQLQICSCWFYSVFMMRPRWLSSPVAWWVLRSGNLLVGPGDRFFCPPQRYYRLFGNSRISGNSRLISCNNNYRYFAILLFVKKSFDHHWGVRFF